MKRIEAILPPARLEDVTDALVESGIGPMTISDSLGWSADEDVATPRRRPKSTFPASFCERVRIEVVVPDDVVSDLINIIVDAARLPPSLGGLVFVSPVDGFVDIRSGEAGDDIDLGHLPALKWALRRKVARAG
jgi:nitrogen regulatory protein P-II 1